MVSASFPQYTTTDLLQTDVINGDNNFGNILFLAQTYTPSNYVKGTFTNLTVQRYDVMKWNGNDSVRIKNPNQQEMILVNGSDFYFTLTGDYVLTSMINSSLSTIITATPETNNTIKIETSYIPTGFNLTFSKTNFTITGSQDIVNTQLRVDDDVQTGAYSIRYLINGIEKTKNFNVQKNLNWTIDLSNFTSLNTIKSGEGKYLGRIVVQNRGNFDVELYINKFGSGSSMITIPLTQTLYRKNYVYIDIQAQVPTVQTSGNYSISLNITAGNVTQMIPINITVIDNINPVIENITFSTDRVYVANDITVLATDNNDVKNVTMTYDGITKTLTKDKNLFTTQVKFDKLSRYVIVFCAYDNDGNSICQTVNKIFNKVVLISNASTSYQTPSVKYGKYSRKKIFTINEKTTDGVTLTLMDLKTNQAAMNTNLSNITSQNVPIVRIVDGKGSIKQFPTVGSITIFDKGDVFVEVRDDRVENLEGVIRVDQPEQFQEIGDITFKTSFKTYDVPEDFSVDWIDNNKVSCRVVDTGDLDTSYYDCDLRYPVGINSEDISIPTTVGERDKFKNEANIIQDLLDKQKIRSGMYIGAIALCLLLVTLYALYMIFWYPYIRFQTGSKKEVKTKDGRTL